MNSRGRIRYWMVAVIAGVCAVSCAGIESASSTEAQQHFEKANELRKLEDYDGAIAEYQKVLNLSPDDTTTRNARYWIGQAHFETRRFDSALAAFQALLDQYPTSSIAPSTKQMIERVQQAKKNRALFEAVKKGDTEQVKSLLAERADINAKWSDVYNENEGDPRLLIRFGLIDSTPLWHAVDSNNMEMVKLLVQEDPNMNAGRWPPLCLAVDRTDTTIVEYLIDHGANVNYPEDWGPLQEAATFSMEKVRLLVARGANVNGGIYQPTIHAGIRSWSREIVEFLIQHGADVNAKDERGRGYTPLQRAAIAGQTEMVKLLLAAGADINARDDNGRTALHVPLDMRNSNFKGYWLSKDTIELLLNKGADVNLKDNDGRTPLYLAAESADGEIVKLLIDHGADVNAREDANGFTALHRAAHIGNMNAAEVLIANGADINAKDKEGHTPLYIAANHDSRIAELLINNGADSTIETESRKTLFQLAQQRKQIESTVPDIIFEGEPNSLFGFKPACGDVDGDGYDDILIGAGRYNDRRGRVYLFYAGPDMDTTADVIFEGQNEAEAFGSVVSCGDIDNDGHDDIVIGAGGYNKNQGRAYLYWGSDRDSMDARPDKIFAGDEESGSRFGTGYPAVYDIDNDGYDDIILGALEAGDKAGRAYLYYGNTKELMDSSYDLIFKGENPGEGFGYTVNCGDVDKDGYADIVVGPYFRQDRTYLYYGGSKTSMDAKADAVFETTEGPYQGQGIVCIDQNRDGCDDVLIGDPLSNNRQGRACIFYGNSKRSLSTDPNMILDGEVEDSYYGVQTICGDIDGDHVKDLIIGARRFKRGMGRAYLYWGSELAGPNPQPGRIFTGENPDDEFGTGLACGDVNKDGFDDLVIGAYGYKGGTKQGRVYLYYGGPRMK